MSFLGITCLKQYNHTGRKQFGVLSKPLKKHQISPTHFVNHQITTNGEQVLVRTGVRTMAPITGSRDRCEHAVRSAGGAKVCDRAALYGLGAVCRAAALSGLGAVCSGAGLYVATN